MSGGMVMNKQGRYLYVPPELLEELEDIHINFNIPKKADCLRIVAKNSKIAREIKLNVDFKFNKKRGKK